jgi:hypothetical protein
MLQAILEPVILLFESNQHTGRLAVTRDDNLLRFRLTKIAGKIILDLGERDFFQERLEASIASRAP